ncbi:MAG TPA: hypothetical protein VNP20_00240 [Nocardioidaceae bacterium]|jgi:hypothetical protein|nr:hypothetical protein [Nocardioidaceae bacterium]
MDLNNEELALLRAHEPGLKPPTRHTVPRRPRTTRRHVAGALRRMANRLEG